MSWWTMGTAVERRLAVSACLNLEHAQEETVLSVVGDCDILRWLGCKPSPLSFFLSFRL
jgi:hypothetical protein